MLGVAGPKAPVPKYGEAPRPNLSVKQICPNCRSDPPNIIEEYSHGDLTFAGDEGGDDPSRVGGPSNPLLGAASLETGISARDGRTGMSVNLQRAATRAAHSAGGGGRASSAQLSAVFAKIAERCDAMQLPRSVTERAQHVYVVADESPQRPLKGKNQAAVIAACIIFACRAAGAHRSFSEVCKATKVSKKELGHVFVLVKTAVQGKNAAAAPQGNSSVAESAEGLLGRFTNYLDLGQGVYNASKVIANAAVAKSTIDGRSPVSIAAGVCFFTCVLFGKQTTAKDIAAIAKVSESTIKLICKMVADKLDVVIRPEWKTQYPDGYAALAALREPRPASRGDTPAAGGTPPPSSQEAAPASVAA
ncbi:transcription initiation factor IIB [Cryptotrichosporon argae]